MLDDAMGSNMQKMQQHQLPSFTGPQQSQTEVFRVYMCFGFEPEVVDEIYAACILRWTFSLQTWQVRLKKTQETVFYILDIILVVTDTWDFSPSQIQLGSKRFC